MNFNDKLITELTVSEVVYLVGAWIIMHAIFTAVAEIVIEAIWPKPKTWCKPKS